MTQNATIRALDTADQGAWRDLHHSYLAFYDSTPDDEATAALWDRLTSQPPQVMSAVADLDGVAVGVVHFHFQRTTWAATAHCYLEDLYVHEQARGRGIATALIGEVERQARAHQCTELYWITRATNHTARRLYDQLATATDFVRYEINLEERHDLDGPPRRP